LVRVSFTQNIQRHVACPTATVSGRTVGDVLNAVFSTNERARGYILDEKGAVRRHLVVFVNGEPIRDRETLTDPVPEDAEVHVMQALSGG
jgi:molybdopterin synthase sulfur carrier subunit